MEFEFFVPLKKIPTVTHQDKIISVKNGKPIIFDSQNLKEAKEIFKAGLISRIPGKILNAPIGLELIWCFPLEKNKVDGDYYTKKPDVDNLAKAFIDQMTKLKFWKDDSHVSKLVSEKRYNSICGVYVKGYEL
ncbi:RusA family crossover junction endodeoxyribonuclease [Gemella morbillorum]